MNFKSDSYLYAAGAWHEGGGDKQATTYSRMQNTIYYKGKSCRQHDGN